MIKCGLGQDSHRFEENFDKNNRKPLILGGVNFSEKNENLPPLSANSDGDVVLHAVTNAISGITCKNILGKIADDMCKSGITDSKEYLKLALKDLHDMNYKINNISMSIECKLPKISPLVEEMRMSIGNILGVPANSVGITATTGEGLTPFGQGLGISVFCIITAEER